MEINRESVLNDLENFALSGSGVIIRQPGVGKIYLMVQLNRKLNEQNIPCLFLPIDLLGQGKEEDLRIDLEYEGDLIQWLRDVADQFEHKPGILQFDAARSEEIQRRFLRIIRRSVLELKGLWNVIVTVRTYDAEKSQELLDLFDDNIPSNSLFYRRKGISARHFEIPSSVDDDISPASHLQNTYQTAKKSRLDTVKRDSNPITSDPDKFIGRGMKKENPRSGFLEYTMKTLLSLIIIVALMLFIIFVFYPMDAKGETPWEQAIPAIVIASLFCSMLLTLAIAYRILTVKTIIILLVPLYMAFSVIASAFVLDISPLEIIRAIVTLDIEREDHVRDGGRDSEKLAKALYKLRSEPETLSGDDVMDLIKKYNFYCRKWHWPEKWYNESGDFKNAFTENGDGTVTDAVTGLIWEKAGSPNHMPFKNAQSYIQELNQKKFAGHNDWRLPTLEEMASLLENKKVDGFYIDPLFDRKQEWCWTSDKVSRGVWRVYFDSGSVDWYFVEHDYSYVRAVRSQTIDY